MLNSTPLQFYTSDSDAVGFKSDLNNQCAAKNT